MINFQVTFSVQQEPKTNVYLYRQTLNIKYISGSNTARKFYYIKQKNSKGLYKTFAERKNCLKFAF